MRIIIITAILWMSACSPLQNQNQYLQFATATKIMAETMRENITLLQQLNIEAQQTNQALSFVRKKQKPQNSNNLNESLNLRLEFLHNLEIAVESLVFNELLPQPQQQRLMNIAQALHSESHTQQINEALQESHAALQNVLAIMVADWQSQAMQSLPKDIVANINANEERLLLLARDDNTTSILLLHQQALLHLQKQKQRLQFLQNWQALSLIVEKMQQAHLSLAANKPNASLQSFYDSALHLQQKTNLILPYVK